MSPNLARVRATHKWWGSATNPKFSILHCLSTCLDGRFWISSKGLERTAEKITMSASLPADRQTELWVRRCLYWYVWDEWYSSCAQHTRNSPWLASTVLTSHPPSNLLSSRILLMYLCWARYGVMMTIFAFTSVSVPITSTSSTCSDLGWLD